MKALTIICDVDEIISDLLGSWLGEYNKKFKKSIYKFNMVNWGIENSIEPKHKDEIYKLLDTPDLFKNLSPLPGAIETLTSLRQRGHEIIICTASAKTPQIAADKITWLKKHIHWFTQDDFFLGRKKYKLVGDVFIDDAPHNIKAYRAHWPKSEIVTIAYPYNQDVKGLVNCYAESYKDTKSAWKQIEDHIDRVASRG